MSVTTEAIEKVEGMILSGELYPGAKLPRENELAERLGVSRSSLREAVRALAALNVIEARQGDGTYVTSLTPEVLLEVVGFGIDLVEDPASSRSFRYGASSRRPPRRPRQPPSPMTSSPRSGTAWHGWIGPRASRSWCRRTRSSTTSSPPPPTIRFWSRWPTISRAAPCAPVSGAAWSTRGVVERTKLWHKAIFEGLEARDPEVARAADLVHLAEGSPGCGGRSALTWTATARRNGRRIGLATTITRVIARDIRFPTSRIARRPDAMNPDPDYSAAYVMLRTDATTGSRDTD